MAGYHAHFATLSSLYLQLCHFVDEAIDSVPDGRRWGDRWAWYAPAPSKDDIRSLSNNAIAKLRTDKPPGYDQLAADVKEDYETAKVLLDDVSWIRSKEPEDRQRWLKDAVEKREYFRYKALDFEKKTFA